MFIKPDILTWMDYKWNKTRRQNKRVNKIIKKATKVKLMKNQSDKIKLYWIKLMVHKEYKVWIEFLRK